MSVSLKQQRPKIYVNSINLVCVSFLLQKIISSQENYVMPVIPCIGVHMSLLYYRKYFVIMTYQESKYEGLKLFIIIAFVRENDKLMAKLCSCCKNIDFIVLKSSIS